MNEDTSKFIDGLGATCEMVTFMFKNFVNSGFTREEAITLTVEGVLKPMFARVSKKGDERK